MHMNRFIPSTHVAGFTQGLDLHSFVFISQFFPSQPIAQLHEYLPRDPGEQKPLFSQGLESQEAISQLSPKTPGGQRQE